MSFLRKSTRGISALFVGLFALNGSAVLGQSPSSTLEIFRLDLQNWYSSTIDRSHGTELLVFSPALSIDPALSSSDPFVSQRSLLLLTDVVPTPSQIFTGSGRRTYDIYRAILDNRAIEMRKLLKDEQRRLKRARNVLLNRPCLLTRLFERLRGKPARVEYSAKYSTYIAFSKKYAELETQLLQEKDPIKRAELESAKQLTYQEWVRKGHKVRVEEALWDLREITSRDPERFWSEVAVEFSRNVRVINGIHLPITRLEPAVAHWTDSAGWTPWQSGNSTGFLKLVSIDRKWLRTEVLTTRPWSWGDGTYKRDNVLVSDGLGLKTNNPKNQLMPLLPVQLLIAKDVVVAGQPLVGIEPTIVSVVCKVLPKLPSK